MTFEISLKKLQTKQNKTNKNREQSEKINRFETVKLLIYNYNSNKIVSIYR